MKHISAWVLGVITTVTGCTVPADGEGVELEETGEVSQELFMTGDGWWNFDTPNEIPICWKNRLFPNLILAMEQAIHEWADNSGVTVTPIPFPDCPTSTPRQATIGFVADPDECAGDGIDGGGSIGMSQALADSAVSYRYSIKARVCPTPGYTGTGGARVFARHEFGHVLGMRHEDDRPENADFSLCNHGVLAEGGITLTDFDVDSVMSYCHNQSLLTAMDIAGLQAAYTFEKSWSKDNRNFCTIPNRKVAVGDFNNDNQDDLVCINNVGGDMSVDLVNGGGQFNGDDWSQAGRGFCAGSSGVLLVGDTRNTGRDDLICANISNGVLQVDRASSTGQFTGTDWSTTRNFCLGTGNKLAAGDFNGDGRADLLCIESGGRMSVDLANTNGEYWSDDWSDAARNFCRFSNEKLYVGDVNGDGRDDLVCNNAGGIYVDRASASGTFTGNDYSNGTRNFCVGSGDVGMLLDLNGDGRQDYGCWNQTTGFMQADLANNYGEFWSTNWQGPFSRWCTGSDKKLLVGTFDSTSKQDLLCVSGNGGLKVQYSAVPL